MMRLSPRWLPALLLVLLVSTAAAAPVDVTAYPLGATVVPAAQGGGAVFRVWAPNATAVNVPGQFNGWNTGGAPMTLQPGTGVWGVHVANAQAGQEYKFYLTAPGGNLWRNDPRGRDSVNTNGNSVLRGDGSGYAWQATSWQTPDHGAMIIHEIHIGTFSGNGDGVTAYPGRFRDVVDAHLADLQALGVNMVEVMPIHEFPATSWGYNPVHLYAPESDYGTPDDFRYLVDRLHQAGIGVILDVVYNHMSNTDLDLWQFDGPANIYFFGLTCQGETPYGSTRPRYTESQVRSWIIDNASHWMREYRLDGLRVDATQLMRGYCDEQGEGWTLMAAVADAVRAVNPRAIAIAEELPNTQLVTEPVASGGAGYDAQWGDLFHDTLRANAGAANPDMGAIANAVATSGFGGPAARSVKYVDNHDESGNGERITRAIDGADPFSPRAIAMNKVLAGLVLLSPGIPMLFQGQEFMEDKPFGDGPADRIWWGFLGTYAPVRDFFGDLGALRRTRASLRAGSGHQTIHVNDAANVFAFQRYDPGGDVTFVIANFSATAFGSYLVGVPAAGPWHELVNSQASAYLGTAAALNGSRTATGTPRDGQPATLDVLLPPHALIVFSQTPLTGPGVAHGVVAR